MNRSELIQRVAEELNLSNRQVKSVVDSTLNHIMEAVVEGDKVALKGFGTFRRTWLPQRNSRHPESGKLTALHPRYTCRFRVSENINRELRDLPSPMDENQQHMWAQRLAHSLTTDFRAKHKKLVQNARQGEIVGELTTLVDELRRRFDEQVPADVTQRRNYLEEELASLLPTLELPVQAQRQN